jgi:hypothetical protein
VWGHHSVSYPLRIGVEVPHEQSSSSASIYPLMKRSGLRSSSASWDLLASFAMSVRSAMGALDDDTDMQTNSTVDKSMGLVLASPPSPKSASSHPARTPQPMLTTHSLPSVSAHPAWISLATVAISLRRSDRSLTITGSCFAQRSQM